MTSVTVTGGLPAWADQGTEIPMQAESSVTVRGWEESAVDHADRFMADLQTLGLHQDEVQQGGELARSIQSDAVGAAREKLSPKQADHLDHLVAAPNYIATLPTSGQDDSAVDALKAYQFTRDNALTKLTNWFAGRRIVVDNRQLAQLQLPLFVLSTYNAKGCVSTYQSTSDLSRKLGWSITIFGTGLSGEATVTASVSSTLTANAGQACLIFLPVTIAVEQVRVVAKDGTTISSGQRVDVSPSQQQHPVPGARLLDTTAPLKPGAPVQTYSLAGYAGDPADYQYVYTQQRAIQLQPGLKAFGADISVTGSVTMSRSITLDFKLAGGRDYQLCRLADGSDGLVWG